ncbi:pantoate--beta-alanine ligase [Coprobacter tertius]|uniref:Pantothenate synthetase n=1 Tax=Coprobacter tertius TaxID=2944915 RepID=A0ABT1MHU6_9BACT|nr:pantoate--beta-alanine ligase [Coprobacter tertius]MCP9611243.1 pantoate--beta-alanine ligase [Coprobacter tertius]
MKVITKIADLQREVAAVKGVGGKVGLVPTMGALHNGHLQLVKRCVSENDCCIVSVFVNPTQFNDKNDLLHYPRSLENDCKLLESVGCCIAFAPAVEEMYPEEDTRVFNLGKVAEVMEGKYRPGHFNGVAQIVSKLFYAATPDRAYFGEKDFQQIAVIRSMAKLIDSPVEIIDCPIVREEDGMALSSRNARLTPEQRKNAVNISATLFKSRNFASGHSVTETLNYVVDTVNAVPGLEVEYYEIVDGNTLLPVSDWNESDFIVGCITVYCGEVRLIDNIAYRR